MKVSSMTTNIMWFGSGILLMVFVPSLYISIAATINSRIVEPDVRVPRKITDSNTEE